MGTFTKGDGEYERMSGHREGGDGCVNMKEMEREIQKSDSLWRPRHGALVDALNSKLMITAMTVTTGRYRSLKSVKKYLFNALAGADWSQW